jgi:hypothetical protein
LNSAYARPRADAIAGSFGEACHFASILSFHLTHRSFFRHKRVFEFQMTV